MRTRKKGRLPHEGRPELRRPDLLQKRDIYAPAAARCDLAGSGVVLAWAPDGRSFLNFVIVSVDKPPISSKFWESLNGAGAGQIVRYRIVFSRPCRLPGGPRERFGGRALGGRAHIHAISRNVNGHVVYNDCVDSRDRSV